MKAKTTRPVAQSSGECDHAQHGRGLVEAVEVELVLGQVDGGIEPERELLTVSESTSAVASLR